MKRSALLAGLMVLAAASSAAAQGRPGAGLFGQARQGIERQVPSRPATATTTTANTAGVTTEVAVAMPARPVAGASSYTG